jgi:four helix bundle protein
MGGVMAFLFEDLDVYKLALDLAEKVRCATKSFPKGEWHLVDQFRRAAMSIPLNIAEGAGRYHPRDKKQFYWIARGSCFECIPIVDLCLRAGILNGETRGNLRGELERVAKMLTGLIRSVGEEK